MEFSVNAEALAALVAEVRERHKTCVYCLPAGQRPCDAARLADEVERLSAANEAWSKDFNSIAKKLDSAEIALGIADAHANVQTARIKALEERLALV